MLFLKGNPGAIGFVPRAPVDEDTLTNSRDSREQEARKKRRVETSSVPSGDGLV